MRFVVLAILLGACATKAEAGACYREAENACTEYGPSTSAAGRRLCAGRRWMAACPNEGRIGTCSKSGATDILYSGAPNNFGPGSAKNTCEWAGGTFAQLGSVR